jgi:hypothetical protein
MRNAMAQVTKVTVWIADLKTLNDILAAAHLHTECGSPRRDTDGNFVVVLYGPAAEAQKVAALGYKHELDDSFGDRLELAHEQVSTTDRYQGGKIKPEGLGVKR